MRHPSSRDAKREKKSDFDKPDDLETSVKREQSRAGVREEEGKCDDGENKREGIKKSGLKNNNHVMA